MAAKVPNPRKAFQFAIEIEGILQFEAQKIDEPEQEIEAVEHGDTNFTVKTAGKIKIGDMTIEKLKPSENIDSWAQVWLNSAQNQLTGGGGLASTYKRDLVIKEYGTDGVSVVGIYVAEGAWVKKIGKNSKDRNASDNVMETITLSVDKYYQVL